MKIALTGGIACGKSLVAKFLNEMGVETLDADDVVHELIPAEERKRLAAKVFADPAARKELEARIHPIVKERIRRFFEGRGVSLCERPVAERQAPLCEVCRGVSLHEMPVAERQAPLCEVCRGVSLHEMPVAERQAPLCEADACRGVSRSATDECKVVPIEQLTNRKIEQLRIAIIPLLFEVHWETDFDILLCVTSKRETQVARMMTTRGYTREEAEARLAAQLSVAEKAAKSHYVIDNDGTADELRPRVAAMVEWLKERK